MNYTNLINSCKEVIQCYNPIITTPDSHLQQFLKNKKRLEIQTTQRVFIKQVFYGYDRYKTMLQQFTCILWSESEVQVEIKQGDQIICGVFVYLICFRFDDLPFIELQKMVLGQNHKFMYMLMILLFDQEKMREKVFVKWMECLELDYLQAKIMPALKHTKDKCVDLMAKLFTINNFSLFSPFNKSVLSQVQKEKKKHTKTQEFNLTKPKPKQLPEIQKIQVGFKAKPMPNMNKDLRAIQQEKKQRRQGITANIKKNYEQNKDKAEFKLQTDKRPSNLSKVIAEMTPQTMKKGPVARPMPKFKEIEVRLNVGSILREENKIRQKIKEQEEKMKNMQINLRDESEWQNWRKQLKNKQTFEQLEAQKRKKIQLQLVREAANKACMNKIEQKRNLVEDMKDIAQELKKQREKLQSNLIEVKKKVIEEVQQSRQNMLAERQKLTKKNRKGAEEQKQQRRRILFLKNEEQKVQMKKRKQLIQQIKDLQIRIKNRGRADTQDVILGFFDEMTVDQLKIRLEEVKRERKKQQYERRRQIIHQKNQFHDSLQLKKSAIFAARGELTRQKSIERENKKQQELEEKQLYEQVKAKSLAEHKVKKNQKLLQKSIQKQIKIKELKQKDQRQHFQNQGKSNHEFNMLASFQRAQEHDIINRQYGKQISEYKNMSIQHKDRQIVANVHIQEAQKRINFDQLYCEREKFDNKMTDQLRQDDLTNKATMVNESKLFKQKHADNMSKQSPYKSKMLQRSPIKTQHTSSNISPQKSSPTHK